MKSARKRSPARIWPTLEPRIAGLAALLVPSTGIVDYRRVALALARTSAGTAAKCYWTHAYAASLSDPPKWRLS